MLRNWLILAIIITGSIHLATLFVDSMPMHWISKLSPMVLIIVLAVTSIPKSRRKGYKVLIVVGLLFCILGDAFLLMPDDSWFTFGLGSFLVGHLLYTVGMVTRLRFSLVSFLSVVPLGVYGYFMGSQLHANITADEVNSGLWIPVLIYLIVILMMCWTAIMSRNWHAAVGALFFVVSDSVLAWTKFVGKLPVSGLLIMATYFTAQLLIAGSIANVFSQSRSVGIRMQVPTDKR